MISLSNNQFGRIVVSGELSELDLNFFRKGKCLIDEIVVNDDIILEYDEFVSHEIVFRKCKFNGIVSVSYSNSRFIRFEQCDFKRIRIDASHENPSFVNCSVGRLDVLKYNRPVGYDLMVFTSISEIYFDESNVDLKYLSLLKPKYEIGFIRSAIYGKLDVNLNYDLVFNSFTLEDSDLHGDVLLLNFKINRILIKNIAKKSSSKYQIILRSCKVSLLEIEDIDARTDLSLQLDKFEFKEGTDSIFGEQYQGESRVLSLKNVEKINLHARYAYMGNAVTFIHNASIANLDIRASVLSYRVRSFVDDWKEVGDFLSRIELEYADRGYAVDKIAVHGEVLKSYRLFIKSKGINTLNIVDYLNLYFSEFISDYGRNWLKSFFVLIVTSIPLYILFIYSLGSFSFFVFDSSTFYRTIDCIGYYFEFIIPIRRGDFMFGIEVRGISLMIDFLARAWFAFVLYQFVRSTRKFVD